MLHVEQEAAGVDETALQVVLAVDEERNSLIQLEQQLQADSR
jgi:hypothetical protein